MNNKKADISPSDIIKLLHQLSTQENQQNDFSYQRYRQEIQEYLANDTEKLLCEHDNIIHSITNLHRKTITPKQIQDINQDIENIYIHYQKLDELFGKILQLAWHEKQEELIEQIGHLKEKMHVYCFRDMLATENYKDNLLNYFKEYLRENNQTTD